MRYEAPEPHKYVLVCRASNRTDSSMDFLPLIRMFGCSVPVYRKRNCMHGFVNSLLLDWSLFWAIPRQMCGRKQTKPGAVQVAQLRRALFVCFCMHTTQALSSKRLMYMRWVHGALQHCIYIYRKVSGILFRKILMVCAWGWRLWVCSCIWIGDWDREHLWSRMSENNIFVYIYLDDFSRDTVHGPETRGLKHHILMFGYVRTYSPWPTAIASNEGLFCRVGTPELERLWRHLKEQGVKVELYKRHGMATGSSSTPT